MRIPLFFKRALPKDTSLNTTFLTEWISKAFCKKTVTFLQVGSNDGVTRDPIYRLINQNSSWSGLFVEPVPYLFERLKKNYSSVNNPGRLQFFKGAINEGVNQNFYFVDEHAKYVIPNLPEWYDQIGSFSKEHILSHIEGILDPFIRSSEIKGISLPELINHFELSQLDLLHIDTEGYDWKILSQLDLEEIQPTVILFEYKHLKDSEIASSIDRLSQKYELFRFKNDFICFHREKHSLTKNGIKILHDYYPLYSQNTK